MRWLEGLVRTRSFRARQSVLLCGALLTSHASHLGAQIPRDLARERSAFAAWLATAPVSPWAAVVQQSVDSGISLGPDGSDIPISGLKPSLIRAEDGIVSLTIGDQARPLARGRPVQLGDHTIVLSGATDRSVVTVFGPGHKGKAPSYYPYDASWSVTGTLVPPTARGTQRILTLDGTEVDAANAGTLAVTVAGAPIQLRVYSIADEDDSESELMIYFRDETNGKGSYPAGRFVTLIPLNGARYQVDFNRARNPFCAYSGAFPCPAPWPGNVLGVRVEAGERYGN
jgi:Protein of unknown function (DUF1684)